MSVTIGIPAHNEERNIEQLLNSIITSTSSMDIELIVVSDGSTDETNNIVSTFSEVLFIIEKERQGKMSAMKRIISNSTGDYILFLDADNLIDSNLFVSLNNCILNNKPNAITGQAKCLTTNSFFDKLSVISCEAWHMIRKNAYANNKFVYPTGSCIMVKKDTLQNLVLNNKVLNDDVYLGLILNNLGFKFEYLPSVIVRIKPPQNLGDFFTQKVRTRLGRRLLIEHKNIMTENEFLWRQNVVNQLNFSNFHLVIVLIFLDFLCRVIARLKIIFNVSHHLWEMAKSTK